MEPRLKAIYILEPEWQTRVYSAEVRAALDEAVEWVAPPQSAVSIRENLARLRDVEVIFGGWGTARLDEAFLAAAPRLRAVFHAGGSIRYFATDAMWARGIVVSTASALNAIPVADYTLATVLFSLRDGWYHERGAQRSGAFLPRREIAGSYGSTVGIVSLGQIGRLVCERLRPIEVEVIAYDPFATEAEARALGVALVGLEEMFARADVVSLHAPWLKETENFIGGAHFAAMKPGATFINTARGAIVNEPEMIAVLQQRPDLTAVLDVTWPEPPVAGSPLYSLPNVVLTPHIAGSVGREVERFGRAMLGDFDAWRRGEPLKYQVTRDSAARLA